MQQILWLLKWILKAAIFFSLFAFALNNQQEVTVHFFFGRQWRASLVLVLLACFAVGLAIGTFGMLPRWWAHRRAALLAKAQLQPSVTSSRSTSPPANDLTAPPHGI